jgi:hypothetical protein
MSESYERERQNNARLDELSAKVSALRGVTVDIYDNARAQDVIHDTVWPCPLPSSLFSFLGSVPGQDITHPYSELLLTQGARPIPSPT